MRRLGPVAIERDESPDEPARRGAIVGRARLGEGEVHFDDPRLACDRDDLARRDADETDQEHEAEDKPDDPEQLGLGEQALDEIRRPQAQGHRDEAAEPGPGEAREREARAGDEARLLRRLDLELRFVDRRRRDVCRNRLVLRADDRFGRERRGLIVDRDAPVVEAEGAGAGRALAHARRSPIRNCSARSSRICGAGSPRWVRGGRNRTNRQSLSASGRAIASPSKIDVGVGRQFAGKDGRLGHPVEDLAADRLALFRHADDCVERLAAGA